MNKDKTRVAPAKMVPEVVGKINKVKVGLETKDNKVLEVEEMVVDSKWRKLIFPLWKWKFFRPCNVRFLIGIFFQTVLSPKYLKWKGLDYLFPCI